VESYYTADVTSVVRSLAGQFRDDARLYQRMMQAGATSASGSLTRTALHNRGLWLLTAHRISHFAETHPNRRRPAWWLARMLQSLGRYLGAVCSRSEILPDCVFDGAVYLSNKGYIMCAARSVGAGSVIHDHCTIGHDVADRNTGLPVIGKNVWVGPGCIITGAITVGNGATILPGSFVTFNVPAAAVIKGNPALIVGRGFENEALRQSPAIAAAFPR
jgi:serine O-acetyltransferase